MYTPFFQFFDYGLSRLFWGGYSGFLGYPLEAYQDTGTTTPATAVGDPIGHQACQLGPLAPLVENTQATAAAKPTLGRAPRGGVRNRAVQTESLSTWTPINVTITPNATTPPAAYLAAASVVSTVAGGFGYFDITVPSSTDNEYYDISIKNIDATTDCKLIIEYGPRTKRGGTSITPSVSGL